MDNLSQRQCKYCKKYKSIDQFYKYKGKRTIGKNWHHTYCKECANDLAMEKYRNNREQRLKNLKRYRNKAKQEALDYYGNKCECCGETRYEFLSFDHINGGGHQHQKSINGMAIGIWLRINNYPDGFRILCYNCNMALGHFGYCPHNNL